jgi:hypothetical protein
MEPRRLQSFYPMLSTSNGGLALAPVSKARTAATPNPTSVESKDLGAPAAMIAVELKEDAAGAHAKLEDANLGRNRDSIISLQRHCDTRHVGPQSARSTHVRDADTWQFVYIHGHESIKSLDLTHPADQAIDGAVKSLSGRERSCGATALASARTASARPSLLGPPRSRGTGGCRRFGEPWHGWHSVKDAIGIAPRT